MIINPIKPKYKNNYAICFASDNNYAKHLVVALESIILKSNNKFQYDIVVLDNGIEENNKSIISNLIKKNKNFAISFFKCKSLMPINLNCRDTVSATAYARLLIPDCFKKYEKVIYLDCDIVVNNDISNLFKINLEDNYIGAARSFIYNAWCYENSVYGKKCRKYLTEKIGLNNVYNFVNSGVLIFNIPLLIKDEYTSTQLFEIASSYLWTGLDEDVINYVFKNRIKLIDAKWNTMIAETFKYEKLHIKLLPDSIQTEYIVSHKNPYILHYVGRKQPIYNDNIEYEKLYWDVVRSTPVYDSLKKEEMLYKSKLKFKINSLKNILLPRNTRRWFFIKKIFRRNGAIKFNL